MSKKIVILNDFEIGLLKGVSLDFINKINDYEKSKEVPKEFRDNLKLTWESVFKKLNSAVLYEERK